MQKIDSDAELPNKNIRMQISPQNNAGAKGRPPALAVPEQLAMTLTGSALRDLGMQRAVDNAEAVAPGWPDRALTMLRRYVAEVGGRFQAEDVRAFGVRYGFEEPPHKRAWGGVMVRARNLGLIRCVGTQPVSTKTSHCANAGLWEAASGAIQ